MNFCEYLNKLDNITVACKVTDGFESVGYIVRRSDIDYSSIRYGWSDTDGTVTYPNTVVTNFALKEGKKGKYIGQLKDAFSGTNVALATGDFRNSFTNTVSFKIFGTGPYNAQITNALANGEYVIILQQKEKGERGESAYRIFGLDNGLVASEVSNDAYDESLGNGWGVTLEETGATSSSYFLFISAGDAEPSLVATEASIMTMFDQPTE